jgi:hypothetical protein
MSGLPLGQYHGVANFGSGRMFLADATESIEPGLLADTTVEWKSSKKPLKAGLQFPSATAVTDQTIEGKSSVRVFSGRMFAKILGATSSAGELAVVSESIAVAATASPTHMGATFGRCLAVLNAAGKIMDQVASAPTAGQYVVTGSGTNKGQLTLNAAEPTGSLTYVYSWTDASKGRTIAITNKVIAAPTLFTLILTEAYLGQPFTFSFNVTIDSWSLGAKGEDWMEVSFSWSANPDTAGSLGSISYED